MIFGHTDLDGVWEAESSMEIFGMLVSRAFDWESLRVPYFWSLLIRFREFGAQYDPIFFPKK